MHNYLVFFFYSHRDIPNTTVTAKYRIITDRLTTDRKLELIPYCEFQSRMKLVMFAIKKEDFQRVWGVVDNSLEFPEGWGRATTATLKWKFWSSGGSYMKFPLWWRYGYFLELHNLQSTFYPQSAVCVLHWPIRRPVSDICRLADYMPCYHYHHW